MFFGIISERGDLVILSEAKDLPGSNEIFRFAQDDKWCARDDPYPWFESPA